jgi:hypothetical protein
MIKSIIFKLKILLGLQKEPQDFFICLTCKWGDDKLNSGCCIKCDNDNIMKIW